MLTRTLVRWLGGALVAVAALFLATVPVSAQTSTGTIRGYITNQESSPISGAEVMARNPETGISRNTTSRADGSYVLPGLVPAMYELSVRHIGSAPQARRVRVQIGAIALENFSLSDQAVELEEVTAVAAAPETRTSEVATNVTQEQIERLPTPSRNFLDLAALAPGVTVTEDRVNGQFRTFSAGGQPANNVNVFIDGTSLKNDLTGGGVSGQDASRGNPFPRSAIQEYRVLSQNFKAEYQKASSAIVTATTKSGGNNWEGQATFNYQDKGLVGLDSIQRRDRHNNPGTFKEPDYSRYLGSLSVGGPIIRDRLHVFASYEGNYQNRDNTVNFNPVTGFPALDTVNLRQYNGNFRSPFRETLLFGKLSYAVNPTSSAEFSINQRHETDIRDFGTNGSTRAFNNAVNFRNNVTIAQLKYNIFRGSWLNEAKVDFSRFRRNPSPNERGVAIRNFQFGGNDNIIGSNESEQDFTQRRLGLRNDLTYNGWQWMGQHTLKGGVSIDFVKYDVVKNNDGTPKFFYNDAYGFRTPYQLVYGTGDPNLTRNNTQLGAYLQDDWSPTPRLTINAGVRWDFESNMFNSGYKTPKDVVDTLTRYNSQLVHPLDLGNYISDGSNRHPFYGAFQPRLGFSYALDKDSRTTIFGGFGIYYDRSIFDISVDETLKLTHPTFTIQFANPDSTPTGSQVAFDPTLLTANKATLDQLAHTSGRPEAWLIANNAKVPKSRQWSIGVRRQLGSVGASVTYAGQRGVDQFVLNWANFGLDPATGKCCTSFDLGPHGFSNFIYSTNDVKTWYDALQIQVDRPYRRSGKFGWGAGIATTIAWRSLQGVDALGDLFAFPNTDGIKKHPANDEKARIVASWITDVPYLFGIQFSGLITLGSGNKQDLGCNNRFCNPSDTTNRYVRGGFSPPGQNFLIFGKWAYRSVDVRLRKDFPQFYGSTLGVTVDVFNLFNYENMGCFDVGNATAPDHPAGCTLGDARRVSLGMEYNF
jgi:hypothetical protein